MSEEEELQETLSRAVRVQAKGDFEQLLASQLASALFQDPLNKIRMVFEAYLLLPDEDKVKVVPDDKEHERIFRLYEVAIGFSNIVIGRPPPHYFVECASVPFPFSWVEGDKYLGLFLNRKWDLKHYLGIEPETWEGYLRCFTAYLMDGYAPLSTVKMVEEEFVVSAMPLALDLLRRIFNKFITRETWVETLSILQGKKKSGVEVSP
ncbi:MAG: hypothetical protein H5T34_00810 [Candidatus Methanomethyliales bacterium]|nr:hypothetical protein [Candidatus Methanomethylicales archaeon]